LASHVYWWWESDKRVDPNTVLWRYVDFAKFVSLLEERSLHFSRADQLEDPFEAASGSVDNRSRWDAHYLEFFRNAIRTVPGRQEPASEEDVEKEAQRLLREFSEGAELDRKRLFVSCWHANAGESEALWRLYCSPPSPGVAIQTRADYLLDAIGDAPIELGKVLYVDFRTGFAGVHERIFTKRKSLNHEAEVRLVLRKWTKDPGLGVSVPADLGRLITAVVPSPFAPTWFGSLVEKTLSRYNVNANVRRSELLAEPFF
jgi:hypothetical protein